LVRKGQLQEAQKSLRRLTRAGSPDFEPEKTIAMMVVTVEHAREISSGTSYWDCFKGVDLRRTEITCLTWATQSLCGAAFMQYSTYFFQQAGLSPIYSFDMTIGQYGLGFLGTCLSWFLMKYFGRRTLYVGGLVALDTVLFVIGFSSLAPRTSAAYWATGSMLLVFTFFYGSIINTVITPYMLNPTAWNWKAKSGFFWAGICFLCLTWTFFRLPEPKGRTYGELDILFERRVQARKFRKADVGPLSSEVGLTSEMAKSDGDVQKHADDG
jgi:SP family general alpha glucoside:H+ symporter-like MFS transporter